MTDQVIVDPWLDWCEARREELAAMPPAYVAIDLVDGVVLAVQDEDAFMDALLGMPEDRRRKLYTTHTRAFT